MQVWRKTQTIHLGDGISREELIAHLQQVRDNLGTRVNPYRVGHAGRQAGWVMREMSRYRGQDLGAVKRHVVARGRSLCAVEGLVFLVGLFVGAPIYFSAFSNGAIPAIAVAGLFLTVASLWIVGRVHAQLRATVRMRRELALWSATLQSDMVRRDRRRSPVARTHSPLLRAA